jgi:hypothetical protein
MGAETGEIIIWNPEKSDQNSGGAKCTTTDKVSKAGNTDN